MKKIDKIGFVIILTTIVLLNIFIGSNIKEPIWLIQMLISLFTTIYIIVKKVQKEKNIIIKANIDIVVTIFMLSIIMPVVLGKQVTVNGSINFILKYWSVYGFYILVRNIVIDDKKIKIVVNAIILSSIIPIIFGYDKLVGINIFEPFWKLIDAVNLEDLRMIATFGYANTFASYLGVTTSLAIAELINSNKKINRLFYTIYIIISSITIILTQSKFVLALLTMIIFIFILKAIKDKKIPKKLIIVGMVSIFIFLVYLLIALRISKPLEITTQEKVCMVRGVQSNVEYKLELDIDATTQKEYDSFEISIVEVSRYLSERTLAKEKFSNFKGTKTLNVKTDYETDHIEIRIKNELKQKIIINELKVNGLPYIIEYKIIPEPVARVFTTFNFRNQSVWQRSDYWRDALKIIKDNWLIGSGGNAWRVLYSQKQEYLYSATEAHSYILEVWMSFGIVGVISLLSIILITIRSGIKQLKENKNNKILMAIIVGLSIIGIHSLMDFDMSFFIIEMLFFMYIALINNENKIQTKDCKVLEICVIVILLIISIGNSLGFISRIFESKSLEISCKIAPWVSTYRYKRIYNGLDNAVESEEYVKKYIKNEPYESQNIMYEKMSNIIMKNEKLRTNENIQFLIDTWKNIEIERKYDVGILQKRAQIMLELGEYLYQNQNLKQYAKEIAEIIQKEYLKNKKIVLDYKRNTLPEQFTRYKYENYTNFYNKAVELLEK